MLAEVVHVSALRENTCVVASAEKPWEEGVVVKVHGSRRFVPGDVLLIEGTTFADGRALGVQADRAQRLRKAELPSPIGAKFADLRLGKLRTRRIALKGEITDIFVDETPDGRIFALPSSTVARRAACRGGSRRATPTSAKCA